MKSNRMLAVVSVAQSEVTVNKHDFAFERCCITGHSVVANLAE